MPAGRAVDWRKYVPRVPPSDWVLVFDCETRTTPDQRLRFGAYQLRYKGQIWERGAFYEPEVLAADELAILRQFMADEEANSDGERIRLLTRAEFVDEVFYGSGYAVGAQIVGFNLPFRPVAAGDPSRQRPAQHARRFQPHAVGRLASGRREAPLAAVGAYSLHGEEARERTNADQEQDDDADDVDETKPRSR